MGEAGWIKSLSFTWAGIQPQNSTPKTRSHERKKIARRRIIHTSLSYVGAEQEPALPATALLCFPGGARQPMPAFAQDPAQPRCPCLSEGHCLAPEPPVSGARACGRGCASLRELPAPGERGQGQGDPRLAALPPGCPTLLPTLLPPPPSPVHPNLAGECLPQHPPNSPHQARHPGRAAASQGLCNPFPNGLQRAVPVPELLAKFAGSAGRVSLGEQLGFPFPLSGLGGREVAGRRRGGGYFHFSAVPSPYWAERHLLSRFSATAPRRGMKPKHLGVLTGLILNQTCRKFCVNCLCWVIVVWGEEEPLGLCVMGCTAGSQAERSTYCFLGAESSSMVIYSLCSQTTPRSIYYLWDA